MMGSNAHLTASTGEFQCIIYQVDDDLLQGLLPSQNRGCSFRLAGHGHENRFVLYQWCECCNHFLCDLVEIHDLLVDLSGCVGLCQLQQLLDQTSHPFCLCNQFAESFFNQV